MDIPADLDALSTQQIRELNAKLIAEIAEKERELQYRQTRIDGLCANSRSSTGSSSAGAMIDCFDRMVVSWSIGTSPDAELVNSMLDAAIETVTENDEIPIEGATIVGLAGYRGLRKLSWSAPYRVKPVPRTTRPVRDSSVD